jgi:preprotein translocase subunit SecE
MVFIMVALAAAFFWIVDTLLSLVFQWVIGIGA